MSRKRVLELFKNLHKVSNEIFNEDTRALTEAKQRIRIEFKKNKSLANQEEINEKIKVYQELKIFSGFFFSKYSKLDWQRCP